MYTQCFAPTANMVVVVGVQHGLGPAVDAVALSVALQLLLLLPVLIFGLSAGLARAYPAAA